MKSNLKLGTLILSAFLSVGVLGGCSKEVRENKINNESRKEEKITKTELFMGTAIKVTIYDSKKQDVMNKCFQRVSEIENLVSINKLGTEVDKVNESAGIKAVKVSDETFTIVEKALSYSKDARGSYDLTIGPLVKLWSIGLPEAKIPTEEEIKEVLKKIDYNKVNLDAKTKEIYLKDKGMKLDLGSIAKGYAADQLVKILKENDVNKAIVDLGGNIYALGEKGKGIPWNIGIQDPFTERGGVIGTITVKDKSIVTSGIYERYKEENGKKYHHILNPETGYPFEGDIAGVSIISDKSIDGDALSTFIFTKGIKDGMDYINNQDGIEAIFISKEKEVYLSDGLKNNFELTNENFKLVD